MEKELDVLGKAVTNPERPFTAIIGGAKVKDKIGVIESLLDKVDNLIIGGGLAYTFVKALGYEVGKSLLEEDKIELAKSFMDRAKEKGVKFYMPEDVLVADDFSNDANVQIVPISEIPSDLEAIDIGTKTRETYAEVIKTANLSYGTDLWAYSKSTCSLKAQKQWLKHWQRQTIHTLSSAEETLRQPLKNLALLTK